MSDTNHDDEPDDAIGTERTPDGDPSHGVDRWAVLVPVPILENASLPRGVVEFLQPLPVVLLGYYEVPDQTAPGQARLQFEGRAEDALAELADEVRAGGGTVETRLVFTDDRDQSIDRVAEEAGCEAELLINPAAIVDSVLVTVPVGVDVARLAGFVAALVAGREIGVELYHAAPDEDAAANARELLAALETALVDAGTSEALVSTRVEVTDDLLEGIASPAEDHDAIVVGETNPSIASFVLGEFPERIADRSLAPVLVLRGTEEEDDDEEPPAAEEDTEEPPAVADDAGESLAPEDDAVPETTTGGNGADEG